MNGWQIAVIVVLAMNMGARITSHGKPKEGKHHAGWAIADVSFFAFLLFKAGAFNQ